MKNTNDRIGWVDWLRVLACFMVVLSHACDAFVGQFDNDRVAFITGTAIGSLMRASVPLFVMMTGVLLLPISLRDSSLTAFYRRRVGRIVWPLVFWSLLLPIIGWAYFNYLSPATGNSMLSAEMYSNERLVPRFWTWIFNFNYDTTALWYLYMLVGLYLVMPIVNGWLSVASRKDVKTVLILWGVSLMLPYVQMIAPALGFEGMFGNFGILGVCDWNAYGTFYYLSGFIGYIILAYYLKTYPLQWSWGRMALTLVPMFVVGYLITFWGYVEMNAYHPGNYAYLEIIWLFCGINVFMMTFPVFAFMQRIKGNAPRIISHVAKLTFGIYLVHFPFEAMAYDLFAPTGLPDWCRIVLSAVCIFVGVGLIVQLLWSWKPTRRFVC